MDTTATTKPKREDPRQDNPQPEGIDLMVVRPGFYGGALRKPGETIHFVGPKLPSWAAIPGTEGAKVKGAPVLGDTKPKAAREAAERKAKGLQEHVVKA